MTRDPIVALDLGLVLCRKGSGEASTWLERAPALAWIRLRLEHDRSCRAAERLAVVTRDRESFGHPVSSNEQVKRNPRRFLADFMFRLTSPEKAEAVANCDHLAALLSSAALRYHRTRCHHEFTGSRIAA